jgi:hypothetical protein
LLRKKQQELQEKLTNTQALVVSNKNEHESREKQLTDDCFRKIKKANDRANEIERRCAKDNEAAFIAKAQGEAYRDEHQRILREQKSEVDKLAEKKIADKIESLKRSKASEVSQIFDSCKTSVEKHKAYYASEYAAKEVWHLVVFSFCIVWLIIQAISSNHFRNEVVVFGNWIKDYAVGSFDNVSSWTVVSANITSGISNDIIALLLYWIIYILIGILSILLFYGVPLVIICGGSFIYLKSKLFDKANRWIMIGTGILFVAMSSEMFYAPKINLLLLWLLIQMVVSPIRFIVIPLIGGMFNK